MLLPPEIPDAVAMVESTKNPNAIGSVVPDKKIGPWRAKGLMQLSPYVIKDYNVENPFDPDENKQAGTQYLQDLTDQFGGDVRLGLAAFNYGPQAVKDTQKAVALKGGGVDYDSIAYKLPAGVQNYVKKVISTAGMDPQAPQASAQQSEPNEPPPLFSMFS